MDWAIRIMTSSKILHRPVRVLASMLALVFAAEVAVMFALPYVIPVAIGDSVSAILDALLLTFLCAPAMWWLIIGPLRRIALQSYERSETVVANACDGILTVYGNGSIASCNRAAADLLGARPESIVGSNMQDFIDDWPSTFQQLPSQMEVEASRADGQRLPLQISVSEFLKIEGKLIAILHDLTASKSAEQERLQLVRQAEALRSQQMSTLAQLATGVAHEIRNPLTSIKMLIQVNRASFAEAGLPTDDLQLVEQEIRRMERSIRDLLDYARPETCEFKPMVLQDVIRRTLQLIHRQCDSQRVEVTLQLPESPVLLIGDASQIHQLLLNLCLNSLDAMRFGGKIHIALVSSENEVELTVTDSGPGIKPEVFDRIFDPFVTTKSSGIGLGLGICRRIAESHGGTLIGTNSLQAGAEFRLTLPIDSIPSQQDASMADRAHAEAASY